MANLVSPGVQVNVVDESIYGPAGAGTVPMLFIATGENKVDPTGTEIDGIAKYTKPEYAGKPILVTSQRELTQYFGNVDFRKVSGSVQQGDETNDYGLLAAYSYLGQSSAAYIVRADVDLTGLRPTTSAPAGAPASETYWINAAGSNFGIFEYTATGWVEKTPYVEVVSAPNTATTPYDEDGYLIEIINAADETRVEYYVGNGGVWANLSTPGTFRPHYDEPSAPILGQVWVKTTQPGGGVNLDIQLYTSTAGEFVKQSVKYLETTAAALVKQDGTGPVAAGVDFMDGDIAIVSSDTDGNLIIKRWDDTTLGQEWDDIGTDATTATGGYVMDASVSEPVGAPVDGALWFSPEVNEVAIYEIANDGSSNAWRRATNVSYATSAPLTNPLGGALAAGDYWVDTDAEGFPVIYRHNGTTWVMKDNTDQSTSNGVVFGDITAIDTPTGSFEYDLLDNAPNPLVFATGTTAVNMCRSAGTVRKYHADLDTDWKWRNFAGNQLDGAGSFGRLAQRKVVVAAMQAATMDDELREETVAFRLLAAPGYSEVYDEMVTLNSDRGETAFIVLDAPFRLNPTEAVSWVQGTHAAENGEKGLVGRNTYSAVYYPSVLATNPVTGDSVVAPATHSVLYTYAYNDNAAYQWFAPAGLTRGVVQNAAGVGYINSENEFVPVSLSQGARDAMYENKLNPIARFVADGIVVFGQKTLSPVSSALDRVNVARLTCYLRERFNVIGRPYLFEPNDDTTRNNAKATFEGFMGNIMALRGVYDFAVVCDTTNNTPARIDANELWIDVAVEPTKAAEFIYIPIRLVNTGEL